MIDNNNLRVLTLSELKAISAMFKSNNRKGTLYSYTAVEDLIQRYIDKGGDCINVYEGGCGVGDWILYGEGLKTTIVKEVFLNEWSSAHKIRKYNKMPEKYKKIIELYESGFEFPIVES